jgi:hypothetical protein
MSATGRSQNKAAEKQQTATTTKSPGMKESSPQQKQAVCTILALCELTMCMSS